MKRRAPRWKLRRTSSPIGVGLFSFSIIVGLSGCKPPATPGPTLSAAVSLEAQAELRELEDEWELRGEVARRELRPRLEAFVQKHPLDPSVARARILLAQIALLERRFSSAENVLRPLIQGRQGNSRDEGIVILAAIDNLRGEHERALSRLEPLDGKLLTREAKDSYSKQRSIAAMGARRWRLAVSVMIAWLVESEPETAHVRSWIESALDEVPSRALSRLLAEWKDGDARPEETQARKWIHRVLLLRLTDEALAQRDSLLARDLLDSAPSWLRASKAGEELTLLAASVQKEANISGRAVGFVLGGRSEEQRRRSVRFVSGVMRGLGLGQASAERKIRTVTTEDRGSISSALGTLTGLGATILVAGVDVTSARTALAFGERQKVPVVVLADPEVTQSLKYGFVFGVSQDQQILAARRGFSQVQEWAFVGTEQFPCPNEAPSSSKADSSPDQWREQGVGAILVLGDPRCARATEKELARLRWAPALLLGLEAAHGRYETPQQSLQVGRFPIQQSTFEGERASEQEKRIAEGAIAPPLMQEGDWFFTMGLDLARLIEAALLTMPDTEVTRADQVKVRHEQARSALVLARADLITSNSRGFSKEQGIEREFSVSASSELKSGQGAP